MRVDDETRAPLLPVVKEHYTQRAQTPGTLLIAEGTMVAAKAGGYPNLPEIWSAEQIAAWKEVTNLKLTKLISDFIPFKVVDAVHAQGNYIILQLAGLGRTAMPMFLASKDPSFDVVGLPRMRTLSFRVSFPLRRLKSMSSYLALLPKTRC